MTFPLTKFVTAAHLDVLFNLAFFNTTLTPPPSDCYLGGIASGLQIYGIGTAIIYVMHSQITTSLPLHSKLTLCTRLTLQLTVTTMVGTDPMQSKQKLLFPCLPQQMHLLSWWPHYTSTLSPIIQSSHFSTGPSSWSTSTFAPSCQHHHSIQSNNSTPWFWSHSSVFDPDPPLSNIDTRICKHDPASTRFIWLACMPQPDELCIYTKYGSKRTQYTLQTCLMQTTTLLRVPVWQSQMALHSEPLPHWWMPTATQQDVLCWSDDCWLSRASIHHVGMLITVTVHHLYLLCQCCYQIYLSSLSGIDKFHGNPTGQTMLQTILSMVQLHCTRILLWQWHLYRLTVHQRSHTAWTMEYSHQNWHTPHEQYCRMIHWFYFNLDPNNAFSYASTLATSLHKSLLALCSMPCCQYLCSLLPQKKWNHNTTIWRICWYCHILIHSWSSPLGMPSLYSWQTTPRWQCYCLQMGSIGLAWSLH